MLLTREENRATVFPSSLRVSSVEEARAKLSRASIAQTRRDELLSIAGRLDRRGPGRGYLHRRVDGSFGSELRRVCNALRDLETFGIASNDTALTAYVHAGVERSSGKRLQEADSLESALIAHLRAAAPDMGRGDSSLLHLRVASQALRDVVRGRSSAGAALAHPAQHLLRRAR